MSNMRLDLTFPNDPEFTRLLARQPGVDHFRVSLELARDAYPQLDFQQSFNWIARRGDELADSLRKSHNDKQLLHSISRCLAGMHGLHGDREAFERPESSYIHRVIETGIGIPISLSVVYVAAARHAGIDLSGVASPMHFLVRYDGASTTYFLDPFNQGRLLGYGRCLDWLQEMTELDADEIEPLMEPATSREIVIRMLNNLKSVYIQQDCWNEAWPIQRRLTALQPGLYEQRRDLALIAFKSQQLGLAVDLLEDCIDQAPDEDAAELVRHHRNLAEQLLSQWN